MSKEPIQSLAPTPKRTLADFLEFIPDEWHNAELGVEQNIARPGYFRVRRVILTVDDTGRRCVIFASQSNPIQT